MSLEKVSTGSLEMEPMSVVTGLGSLTGHWAAVVGGATGVVGAQGGIKPDS